jgi:hypothetical protein
LEVETKNDLRLIRRAMKEGWNVPRQKVVNALLEALQDPELLIDAAKLLIAADSMDIKREELEAKTHGNSEQRRLQLLALAQRVPVGDLARLASEHGIASRSDDAEDDGSGIGQSEEGS